MMDKSVYPSIPQVQVYARPTALHYPVKNTPKCIQTSPGKDCIDWCDIFRLNPIMVRHINSPRAVVPLAWPQGLSLQHLRSCWPVAAVAEVVNSAEKPVAVGPYTAELGPGPGASHASCNHRCPCYSSHTLAVVVAQAGWSWAAVAALVPEPAENRWQTLNAARYACTPVLIRSQ